MSARAPSLFDVIQTALNARLADLHVALPARVERYDAARQMLDAQPLLLSAYQQEDGSRATERIPVITNVPVLFPGAGGFRLTFPVEVGDTVLLIFAERSLDRWLALGGEVDPADRRMHDLTDAVAIPGLRAQPQVWTGVGTEHATMGQDGGLQIHFKDGAIALGEESPPDAVAMAQKVAAELEKLRAAFNTHTHAVSTTGTAAAQTGATTTPLTPAPAVGSVGSTSVLVKG